MNFKTIFSLLKETWNEWNKDGASTLAASLAYYTIFSIAPLLIIAIAIAGSIFGEEAARGEIVSQIQGLVGKDGAEVIETAIKNSRQPEANSLASLISIVILLFGASGVFAQLQDALNTIWNVKVKPQKGVINFIRKRLLSFSAVLGIGFLLLVSLVVSASLAALAHYLGGFIGNLSILARLINFAISFGVITLLFGFMFKYLPDVKITWNDVTIGAVITALLFTTGKFFLGMYLGTGTFGSTYGAAGSLVIVLIWVYYSAQILFFGAEFTQVYASRYGSQIVPNKYAERADRDKVRS